MIFQTPSSSEKQHFNRSAKIKLLKKAFPNALETRLAAKNELIIYCPKHYHHKPKLEINVENDIYHCWVCGNSGLVPKLLRQASRIELVPLYVSYMETYHPTTENVSEGILVAPRGVFGALLNQDQKTAVRRKIDISESDIVKGNIGISIDEKYQNRIIFPSFNKFGKINYFTTRSFDDFGMKYISAPISSKNIIFNELYINWKKPIVLTESIKTHYKMFDIGNYIPILGSKLHENSKILFEIIANKVEDVTLMFDMDAKDKQFEAATILTSYGIEPKIVNDLKGVEQPDKLCVNDIIDCVKQANKIENNKDLIKMKIARKL